MKDILAFVGPSGSGKTTLILEALQKYPQKLGHLLSMTTRPPRDNAEDVLVYEFVTKEEFERRIVAGEFIHFVEHAGNYYGTLRRHADDMLRDKYAISAFVEQGVINLRNSGYTVRVIKIRPVGGFTPHDEARITEDAVRDKMNVQPEIIVENDFAPGGRERAISALFAYIDALP